MFFERIFLVGHKEQRASGGLSFLRNGPANMVYSYPETVSDVYVNQEERLQKREGGREKEARNAEGGRENTREGERREEFAKMPSYGSLQQAVKVRPRRGEKPHKFVDLCLQVEYFAFCGMKLIFTLDLSCKAHLHLSHINASNPVYTHSNSQIFNVASGE